MKHKGSLIDHPTFSSLEDLNFSYVFFPGENSFLFSKCEWAHEKSPFTKLQSLLT